MNWAFYLVAVLGIALTGFASGVKYEKGVWAQAEQKAQVNQRATERLQRQNTDTAAEIHEGDKTKLRVVYRTITEEVERVIEKPVYRDVCLDDDGLRILRSAVAGANGAAGEPANSLRTSATTP